MPSKIFDNKELKRLLKGHLLSMVVDMGLGAGEKVKRKGKKVVNPIAQTVFCKRVDTVRIQFLGQ